MSRKRNYERVAHDVATALVRREITFREFGALCFLILRADFRPDPPEYSGTLAGLMERLDWDATPRTLQRALRKLEKQGWIEYEARPGRGSIYVIKLRERASMRDDLLSSRRDRVAINKWPSQLEGGANPDGNSDSADSEDDACRNSSVPTTTTPTTNTTTSPTTIVGDDDLGNEEKLSDEAYFAFAAAAPTFPVDEVDRLLEAVRPEDRERTARVFRGLRKNGSSQADFERAIEDVLQFGASIRDPAAYAVSRLKAYREEGR
jgi:hypothetical protein